MKKICIHGHFYQPPRENPWLEDIELQDSAYPDHDWNERIAKECYLPNAAARLVNDKGQIIDIINNYSKMNFNFGPTLLKWMRDKNQYVYNMVRHGEKLSLHVHNNHSSAIAQTYNHMIMPLTNERDKKTQVIWGIEDYSYHFKKKPKGMWLPETGVDTESLEALAGEGIQFTILAASQAKRIRKIGEEEWQDPFDGYYLYSPFLLKLPSGKTINIFFYDGGISFEISFGPLLQNGESLAKRLISVFHQEDVPQIVMIATDGETFGHHKQFGDMALASCFRYAEKNHISITNLSKYLDENPPRYEAEIHEKTAWSCAHGVGRWCRDCSCNMGKYPEGNQQWREHLRNALDFLRDEMARRYEDKMKQHLKDPWKARDDYIHVILDRSKKNIEEFFKRNANKELSHEDKKEVLRYLEMQRHAMLMYTSCGWFFDDISGIETVQILSYAKRVIELSQDNKLEEDFLNILRQAKSNEPQFQNGEYIYKTFINPISLDQVSAHYAISTLFYNYPNTHHLFCFEIYKLEFDKIDLGLFKFANGKIKIFSKITWEEKTLNYISVNLKNYQIYAFLFDDEEKYKHILSSAKQAFEKKQQKKVLQLLATEKDAKKFSVWDLFIDERKRLFDFFLFKTSQDIKENLQKTIEKNFLIIKELKSHNVHLSNLLQRSLESFFSIEVEQRLEKEDIESESFKELVKKIIEWKIQISTPYLQGLMENYFFKLVEKWKKEPFDINILKKILNFLDLICKGLKVSFNLWHAQNVCYNFKREHLRHLQKLSKEQDIKALQCVEVFTKIAKQLYIAL